MAIKNSRGGLRSKIEKDLAEVKAADAHGPHDATTIAYNKGFDDGYVTAGMRYGKALGASFAGVTDAIQTQPWLKPALALSAVGAVLYFATKR